MLIVPAASLRPGLLLSVVAACGLASGCSSAPRKGAGHAAYASDGAVSAEIVDAPSGGRYQALPGSTYFNPLPIRDNVQPAYPSELLARRLPAMVVVARIVVDGTGAVERADVVESAGDEPAFGDAVLSAVRGWTFIPLKRVTGDRIERLPFTQDYRFTFSQVNGRALVESGGN